THSWDARQPNVYQKQCEPRGAERHQPQLSPMMRQFFADQTANTNADGPHRKKDRDNMLVYLKVIFPKGWQDREYRRSVKPKPRNSQNSEIHVAVATEQTFRVTHRSDRIELNFRPGCDRGQFGHTPSCDQSHDGKSVDGD